MNEAFDKSTHGVAGRSLVDKIDKSMSRTYDFQKRWFPTLTILEEALCDSPAIRWLVISFGIWYWISGLLFVHCYFETGTQQK